MDPCTEIIIRGHHIKDAVTIDITECDSSGTEGVLIVNDIVKLRAAVVRIHRGNE